MLCGRLSFEDDNVQVLFTEISQGTYHMPLYFSSDTRNLIPAMLAVDWLKLITIPDNTEHPFFTGVPTARRRCQCLAEFEEQVRDTHYGSLANNNDNDDPFPIPPLENTEINNFSVLNSSLPEQLPEQHLLMSYMSTKRSWAGSKEQRQHHTKWHFGICSRSPPMQIMLEIYRTLKMLGMEWKQNKTLGGLGCIQPRRGPGGIERAHQLGSPGPVDLKAATGVHFVLILGFDSHRRRSCRWLWQSPRHLLWLYRGTFQHVFPSLRSNFGGQ
ncbi:Protein kinase [Pleurotus pulmonarius]|nr:Protein kinase [Pleurotus pulmonarius]